MGVAGGSARREYERRLAAREARVKGRAGTFLGSAILALTDEPQSTRAWARGASGEQKLGNVLSQIEGVRVLHDRAVPGTRGNIDHIVISCAGVFVVDAKHYKGEIHIRDCGGLLRSDHRLFIGDRDRSDLARNMAWQVAAVERALSGTRAVRVSAVLCFVDGEWPLLFPPKVFEGVHLTGLRSIKKLVTSSPVLEPGEVEELTGVLASRLRAKVA